MSLVFLLFYFFFILCFFYFLIFNSSLLISSALPSLNSSYIWPSVEISTQSFVYFFFSISLPFCFLFLSLVGMLSGDFTLWMGCHICHLFRVDFLFLDFLFLDGVPQFLVILELNSYFQYLFVLPFVPSICLFLSLLLNTDACCGLLSSTAAVLIV